MRSVFQVFDPSLIYCKPPNKWYTFSLHVSQAGSPVSALNITGSAGHPLTDCGQVMFQDSSSFPSYTASYMVNSALGSARPGPDFMLAHQLLYTFVDAIRDLWIRQLLCWKTVATIVQDFGCISRWKSVRL